MATSDSGSKNLPWTYNSTEGPQIHGRVPRIIMKMGTRGPYFMGSPKFYDTPELEVKSGRWRQCCQIMNKVHIFMNILPLAKPFYELQFFCELSMNICQVLWTFLWTINWYHERLTTWITLWYLWALVLLMKPRFILILHMYTHSTGIMISHPCPNVQNWD